ncbi:MAG TPA: hypothetical protein VFX64_01610 [Candidatus Nitrosotalea sp.]|nr:hypothetical protein [Candidatus Nitrosotalea sp.]
MRILPYGLVAILMLALIVPAISFAESEDEDVEKTNHIEHTQSTNLPQTEHEGDKVEHSTNPVNSDMILFVTISAIVSVVGYSVWKVYKARRKAAFKRLV